MGAVSGAWGCDLVAPGRSEPPLFVDRMPHVRGLTPPREERAMTRKTGLVLAIVAGMLAAISVLFAGAASAQNLACPAGGRGGSGGDAGRSLGGNGGLAFTVGGLGTAGSADASGGTAGSARGGTGGRGGSGNLPICNQNTNGGGGGVVAAPAARAAAPAAAAAPRYGTGGGSAAPAYGVGGGLARTGSRTNAEIGLAGLAFLVGAACCSSASRCVGLAPGPK